MDELEHSTALKAPRQCLLVLLVEVDWKQDKLLRSKEPELCVFKHPVRTAQ